MKLVMISQTMRNLRNTLKSQTKLATKVMTNHGEANPLRRMRNHKYKKLSISSKWGICLSITNGAHMK